jgi:UDP-N-acetylglucosamine diphosphorylase / glucose-1-phosphate thymidylyltransferase / UDP-N-acetylgalactosamine diphosphorylase / glucosamine-1-phosphate N-acetyltransferase / galactosamine-1-phosphate N-acetyltransferase
LANEGALLDDWAQAGQTGIYGQVDAGSYLLNESAIFLGEGARIKPCVVIDAEDGPVWIGENVQIMPHAYIQGPAYIGAGSLIQPGAVVHEGTTIGPVCKVGGEIEASILHGYSNKQHDGFLGHSYVGQWVNIAADCINSDLKNTYGSVRVPINGYEVDTGEQFVGMFMGDHSKAGINVSFPTGAVVGFCSSVFASVSPKFVPSFAWIDGSQVTRYDEQRGVAIGKTVMARRNQVMKPAEEQAFLSIVRQALAIERQPLDEELLETAGGTA